MHIAELAGAEARAVDQLVITENRPADAGADGQDQKVAHVGGFPPPALGQQHAVGIILNGHGQANLLLKPAFDGEVIEFTDGAAHFDKAGVRVNVAGRADCHPFTRRVSGDPRQHRLQDLVAVAVDDVLLSFLQQRAFARHYPHF